MMEDDDGCANKKVVKRCECVHLVGVMTLNAHVKKHQHEEFGRHNVSFNVYSIYGEKNLKME